MKLSVSTPKWLNSHQCPQAKWQSLSLYRFEKENLNPGEFVVSASDGLWDNFSPVRDRVGNN